MKTERVRTGEGRWITLYYPESNEDVDKLNKMLDEGKIMPPTGSPAPVVQ